LEECLIDAANRGGDADTTAAIAGMLAGAHYGMAAIPARWLKQLDPAIREACSAKADQLSALMRPRAPEIPPFL